MKAGSASSGRYVSTDGAWRSRVHSPRITGLEERRANVARATSRIKTDVQVDVARSRRGK